jgi:hypothetical protein
MLSVMQQAQPEAHMSFIKVYTSNIKTLGHRFEYSLESNLSLDLSVQSVGISPIFELFLKSKRLCVVSYSGFHSHAEYWVNETKPNKWDGFQEGEIGFNDENLILVNSEPIGKIENSDIFQHFVSCLKNRKFVKFSGWIKVEFDEKIIAPQNALALVLIKLSFLKS